MPGLQMEGDNKKLVCIEKYSEVPCVSKFIAQKELLPTVGQIREKQIDSSSAKLRRQQFSPH